MNKIYLLCERSVTYRRVGKDCKLFSETEVRHLLEHFRTFTISEKYVVSNAYRLAKDAYAVCKSFNDDLSICSIRLENPNEVVLTLYDYFVKSCVLK